jgi:hypothetical protein
MTETKRAKELAHMTNPILGNVLRQKNVKSLNDLRKQARAHGVRIRCAAISQLNKAELVNLILLAEGEPIMLELPAGCRGNEPTIVRTP